MEKDSTFTGAVSAISVLAIELVDTITQIAPLLQIGIQTTIGLLTIVFLVYKIKHVKNAKHN